MNAFQCMRSLTFLKPAYCSLRDFGLSIAHGMSECLTAQTWLSLTACRGHCLALWLVASFVLSCHAPASLTCHIMICYWAVAVERLRLSTCNCSTWSCVHCLAICDAIGYHQVRVFVLSTWGPGQVLLQLHTTSACIVACGLQPVPTW